MHKVAQKGFTLVELLIVIAILTVLAAIVMVGINPLEQLAKGRDAGRFSAIAQIGHALQSYASTQGGTYPAEDINWINTLIASGELKISPQNSGYPGGINNTCTRGSSAGGYCYQTDITSNSVVYAKAESNAQIQRAGCSNGQNTWIVWSSAAAKSGLACIGNGTEPGIGITNLQ